MVEDTEETGKIIAEYEQYKNQIEALQETIAFIDAHLLQIDSTLKALEVAGSAEGDKEILLPIGSDSFIRAKITDRKNAIVGIGSGVAVKKSFKEAIAALNSRKKDLEESRKQRYESLEKLLTAAQEITPKLQEIVRQAQKEG